MVKLHEFLHSIVFYKDKVLISLFWLHLFELPGISLKWAWPTILKRRAIRGN